MRQVGSRIRLYSKWATAIRLRRCFLLPYSFSCSTRDKGSRVETRLPHTLGYIDGANVCHRCHRCHRCQPMLRALLVLDIHQERTPNLSIIVTWISVNASMLIRPSILTFSHERILALSMCSCNSTIDHGDLN